MEPIQSLPDRFKITIYTQLELSVFYKWYKDNQKNSFFFTKEYTSDADTFLTNYKNGSMHIPVCLNIAENGHINHQGVNDNEYFYQFLNKRQNYYNHTSNNLLKLINGEYDDFFKG